MNKVCLLGRICADPAVKEINGKNKLADFTLAVDRGLSKEAKEKAKQTADFIRCKAWSQKAELIEKYLKKGDQLALTGKIQVSSFEDNDGKRIYTTDVIVEGIDFIRKQSVEENEPKQSCLFEESDLPF